MPKETQLNSQGINLQSFCYPSINESSDKENQTRPKKSVSTGTLKPKNPPKPKSKPKRKISLANNLKTVTGHSVAYARAQLGETREEHDTVHAGALERTQSIDSPVVHTHMAVWLSGKQHKAKKVLKNSRSAKVAESKLTPTQVMSPRTAVRLVRTLRLRFPPSTFQPLSPKAFHKRLRLLHEQSQQELTGCLNTTKIPSCKLWDASSAPSAHLTLNELALLHDQEIGQMCVEEEGVTEQEEKVIEHEEGMIEQGVTEQEEKVIEHKEGANGQEEGATKQEEGATEQEDGMIGQESISITQTASDTSHDLARQTASDTSQNPARQISSANSPITILSSSPLQSELSGNTCSPQSPPSLVHIVFEEIIDTPIRIDSSNCSIIEIPDSPTSFDTDVSMEINQDPPERPSDSLDFYNMDNQQLKKQMDQWGFKPVKSRKKMIDILNSVQLSGPTLFGSQRPQGEVFTPMSEDELKVLIFRRISNQLKTNPLAHPWWMRILCYQPISAERFSEFLKVELSIDVGLQMVKDWCDQFGVTMTNSDIASGEQSGEAVIPKS